MTELQQQIEAVRREAFAAGYTAAMKEVKELVTGATPEASDVEVSSGHARDRGRSLTATRAATSRPAGGRRGRRTTGSGRAASGDRSGARPPRRGMNAVLIAEVLKSAAPRALRAAEIRRALQDKGTTMSFPSIGYSLRQLAARNAARQVGHNKTWRYQKR